MSRPPPATGRLAGAGRARAEEEEQRVPHLNHLPLHLNSNTPRCPRMQFGKMHCIGVWSSEKSSRLTHMFVLSHWNLCCVVFHHSAFHLWKRRPVLVTQSPPSLSSLLHWSLRVAHLHLVSETRHGLSEALHPADHRQVPQRSRQPREWSLARPTPQDLMAALTGHTRRQVSARWHPFTLLSVEILFLFYKWDWSRLLYNFQSC